MMHGLGEEPVSARYLVERRYQQRVVGKIGAEHERTFDAVDHHVEVVVGAERDLPRHAALWRFGVDVVEFLETGRVFQIAERRYAVPPRGSGRVRGAYPGGQRQPPRGQRNKDGCQQRSAIYRTLPIKCG